MTSKWCQIPLWPHPGYAPGRRNFCSRPKKITASKPCPEHFALNPMAIIDEGRFMVAPACWRSNQNQNGQITLNHERTVRSHLPFDLNDVYLCNALCRRFELIPFNWCASRQRRRVPPMLKCNWKYFNRECDLVIELPSSSMSWRAEGCQAMWNCESLRAIARARVVIKALTQRMLITNYNRIKTATSHGRALAATQMKKIKLKFSHGNELAIIFILHPSATFVFYTSTGRRETTISTFSTIKS